jgi:hypothetical protein
MSEVIKHIESSVKSLEEQSKIVQDSYRANTDIISKWVDIAVGVFWGETVKESYEQSIARIHEQARIHELKLLEEVSKNNLDTIHSHKASELKSRLWHLQWKKLEDVSLFQMTQNVDIRQSAKNAIAWIRWEVKGTINWLKGIITWAFDLASFMVKYSGSMLGIHPEYKQKIDIQAGKLYDWIQKEWISRISEQAGKLIENEMKRISQLPQEEQAEAIGNIAGNIISMLTAIKTGTMIIEKTGKVSRQLAIGSELAGKWWETAQRVERLAKLAELSKQAKRGKVVLEGTNVLLSWVAESMIGYAVMKNIHAFLEIIEMKSVNFKDKIAERNKLMSDIQSQIDAESDPQRIEALEKLWDNLLQDDRVEALRKQERRYNDRVYTLVDNAHDISARMFHIGEELLRKNPDITSEGMKTQMLSVLKWEWIEMNSVHMQILEIWMIRLDAARKNRQAQLVDIFWKAKVEIPKDISEVQNILNNNPDIQFSEWKRYMEENWWWKYIQSLFDSYPESAKTAVAKKYWLRNWFFLWSEDVRKFVWIMEWWASAMRLDITSHPTSIIYSIKKSTSFNRKWSHGHIKLSSGKIYLNGHDKNSSIVSTIEHEYQHFLDLNFVEPIVSHLYNPSVIDSTYSWYRKRDVLWKLDDTPELREQWLSTKDEIASYLERNARLPLYTSPYLSKIDWVPSIRIYGDNYDRLEKFLYQVEVHRKSQNHSSGKLTDKEIVDIIRTSISFQDAYDRLSRYSTRRWSDK